MAKTQPSEVTKKVKEKRNLYLAASLFLNIAPIVVCFFYIFTTQRVVDGVPAISSGQKFAFSASIIVALSIFVINILAKLNLRSPTFIIILGLLIALSKIINVAIYTMAYICVVVILDEFWLTPGYKKANTKLTINKEIDMREAMR